MGGYQKLLPVHDKGTPKEGSWEVEKLGSWEKELSREVMKRRR
jgi:hypothetical protein